MDSLLKGLGSNISDSVIEKLASSAGVDSGTAKSVLDKAIPAMTGALAKNTSTDDGAKSLADALDKDHDGGILSHVEDVVSGEGMETGTKILGHVFGGSLDSVTEEISSETGSDTGSTAKILAMAAPLVLGTLGKAKNESGMDSGMLASALKMASGSGNSGIMGMLDLDKDGSVVDDLPKIIGFFGIIKKFLGKK